MCCGGAKTLFTAAPEAATDPSHPPLLVDENGRLYVRLADRLSSANDSVTIERGSNYVVLGAHGNAWNNTAVLAGGTSNAIDTGSCSHVSVLLEVNAACSISIMISIDGVNWYEQSTVNFTGADSKANTYFIGAKFVKLQSDAAATITASICAKG